MMLRNVSLAGLLSLALCLAPLAMSVLYLARPTERNLALMRPLSLTGLFAALTGCVLGFINVLSVVWTREATAESLKVVSVGAAESLVTLFVGFGTLTVAWLLVAIGMSRQGPTA